MIFGDPEWKDYTVEVEFQKTGGTKEPFQYDAGVSLMFRATNLNEFYWLRLGVSDNREHSLEVCDGGAAPITRKVPGSLQDNRWYQLRVSVVAESMRIHVDDRLLFDLKHSRHRKGGIGIGNWLATTRWRNLKVQGSDGSILMGQLPDPSSAISPKNVPDFATIDELNQQIRNLESKKARLPIARSIADNGRDPRETRLFLRGDHRTPGPVVQPAVPATLTTRPVAFNPLASSIASTGRRLALADWLTSAENPLVARVMVNRIWQYHFGRGLVDTPSNFGLRGSKASHPKLLDWLASEFVRSGWSIKHMHRLMMTSSVYRQSGVSFQLAKTRKAASSKLTPRLLSRFPKRRLEAELIRDRILAASGSLNRSMHGPGVRPRIHPSVIETSTTRKWPTIETETPEHWRRSVYIFVRRSVLMPMLEAFDSPTTTQSCERRLTTTVATQALQLMNDAFTNEQATIMARRVANLVGSDFDKQIEQIYWRSLSRKPTTDEQNDSREFLEQQRSYHGKRNSKQAGVLALTDLCHVMFNLNEFVYVD
ncbi:MAG: hypothetical protein CMJ78_18235 [Planctomycetaceae bacterium]|nr:hypothetical protein [Planctomycetaceae bacterium]